MSLGAGHLDSGTYTVAQLEKLHSFNTKTEGTMKPTEAFYKKSMGELGPNWKQKREIVNWLIEDSNISPISKRYLKDCEDWVPRYQYRGFKYGLLSSTLVYLFFPVVRRQPFVRRFAFSMIPMYYFLAWGHVWGHENMWRRAKEVVVTYEILAGARSKFTMK